MGTYKDNIGHLMQHWTLCEVLTAVKKYASRLNFIDAHAMAPWATKPTDMDHRFTRVRDNLPGQGFVYEQSWQALAERHDGSGYPNSAAFVREVWRGNYSLLLCEINPETADEIQQWLRIVGQETNCKKPELFPGDWRSRFELGLPSPADPDDTLTLVSFDPHLYSRHPHGRPNREGEDIIRPQHLKLAVSSLSTIKGGILIQLSTYSSNGSNPQDGVIASVDSILKPCGFHRLAKVRPLNAAGKPHGHMMSLVYTKGVAWSTELADLPSRFNDWMRAIRRRRA